METIHTGAAAITFPTTPEAFIAYQEATFCRKFDAFSREMADLYVDLFNLEFDAGVKGLDPINIAKSTAEFYMKIENLKYLEKPIIRDFYTSVQHWCNEAYRQGKESRNHE